MLRAADGGLKRAAVSALAGVSHAESGRAAILRAGAPGADGAVSALVAMLSQSDEGDVVAAAECLQRLAINDAGRVAIGAAEAIPSLIHVLRSFDNEALAAAVLGCLELLAYSRANRAALRDPGFLTSEKDAELAQKLGQLQPFVAKVHRNARANLDRLGQPDSADTFLAAVLGVLEAGGEPVPAATAFRLRQTVAGRSLSALAAADPALDPIDPPGGGGAPAPAPAAYQAPAQMPAQQPPVQHPPPVQMQYQQQPPPPQVQQIRPPPPRVPAQFQQPAYGGRPAPQPAYGAAPGLGGFRPPAAGPLVPPAPAVANVPFGIVPSSWSRHGGAGGGGSGGGGAGAEGDDAAIAMQLQQQFEMEEEEAAARAEQMAADGALAAELGAETEQAAKRTSSSKKGKSTRASRLESLLESKKTVRAAQGRLSALRVFLRKSILHGAFV